MNIKEIRIGNTFNVLGKERDVLGISKHNGKNETSIHYVHFKGNVFVKIIHLKPIPITPQDLIKYGFQKDNRDVYHFYRHYKDFDTKSSLISFYFYKDTIYVYVFDSGLERNEKKQKFYLHQLQNIFFELTGE